MTRLGRPGRDASMVALSIVGLGAALLLWWVLALTVLRSSDSVPTPPAVLRAGWNLRHVLWSEGWATGRNAAIGFTLANALAVVAAVLFAFSKTMERALFQVSIVIHSLPIVAIGPILQIALRGNQPRIMMAALVVFFTSVVTVQLGLRAANRTSIDLLTAYGAGRWTTLRKAKLPAALPAILTALKLTAPLAVLGATIGEFLGGRGGLGALLVNAQDQANPARLWAIAATASIMSMAGYGFFAGLKRVVTPWASSTGGR